MDREWRGILLLLSSVSSKIQPLKAFRTSIHQKNCHADWKKEKEEKKTQKEKREKKREFSTHLNLLFLSSYITLFLQES